MRRALGIVALAAAAYAGQSNQWVKVDQGKTGQRAGSVLLAAPDLEQLLLIGPAKDAPFVQAFDPAARAWSEVASAAPAVRGGIHPYYQAAYDPGTKTVYCLSGGQEVYSFSLADKTWAAHPPAPELEGLSWQTMACDPVGKRLAVVGADKRADNLGWCRTAVYDIPSGKWTRLDVADPKVVQEHKELVAAREAAIDLVGRIRLAWFRDPKGAGTDAERKALAERCDALKKMPQTGKLAADIDAVAALVSQQKMLEALSATRSLEPKLEEVAKAQYPVPCSRRNSPLAFDEKNRVFVLFGGDHEDYLMNDTWVLDLEKLAWREARPEVAPSPRAGHALVWLPKSGRVLSYEGYVGSSSRDYGASPWQVINPREMWAYDVKANRWDLVGAWPIKRGDASAPPPLGGFYGYSASWFNVPALAADANDALFLAAPGGRRSKATTWKLEPPLKSPDEAGRAKLGKPPGERRYRTGIFRAEYWERPDDPGAKDLAALPANKWTPMSPKLRLGGGCRQRDWGTSVWDSDRGQVLLWGGGHCVRSSSAVVHYSPVSNRMVESYDPEEPYCYNGFCGPGSSLMNRLWVNTHAYNLYAYDPKCKLLVTGFGFLYDPARMDWVRRERVVPPFRYSWGHVVVETTPHGALCWAEKGRGGPCGLWLFDVKKGWTEVRTSGEKLPSPYCDSEGMVYDSKRDRMLLGWGAGYNKRGDGRILALDFKTGVIAKLMPGNTELGQQRNTREMVYVPGADVVLFGSDPCRVGGGKKGRTLTRVYKCAEDEYALLDGGNVAYGHSCGWMYDAKHKCAIVFTYRADPWAMRVDPATLKLLKTPPEQ